jgi:phosphorylcholine metabolism protein LicD
MNSLHENLFKLLIEIDDICNEHDIDYCLAGGTALGAIRNQCFLPWDDDIDLYITRDNWLKFYDLISKHPEILPENRNLVCIENAPYHRNPIVRYVDTSKTTIYPAQSISAKTCGDQIEFFILDPIPNEDDGRKEHLNQMRAFLEILSPYFMVCHSLPLDDYADHRDLVLSLYDEIKRKGYSAVMDELYEKLYNYPMEKADTLCLRWGKRTLLHEKRFYSDKRYEELEGRKFPVAYELEHALRTDYGDTWMYIPQGEGKISHNPLVEDPNRPFEDFTSIYLKFIDQEKVTQAYETNKRSNLKSWIPRTKVELEKARMKGILVKVELEKKMESNGYDLKQLLEDKDYEILNKLFEDYYSIQLHQNCRKYNFLIDIDKDIIKIALLNKINQGQFYTARNIINILEKNFELDSDFKHYKDMCIFCKKLSIAIYDDHDAEMLESLLNNMEEDCEGLVDTYRAILWLDMQKAEDNDDYEHIISKGNELLRDYPDDGEIMAYIAEAHYHLGEEEKAREIFDKAVHHTRNGFVWQNAKRYVGIDRMAEEEIDVD